MGLLSEVGLSLQIGASNSRNSNPLSKEQWLRSNSVCCVEPDPCCLISSNPLTSQQNVTKFPILQNKETKAQRGHMTGPKLHSREQKGWGRPWGLSLCSASASLCP